MARSEVNLKGQELAKKADQIKALADSLCLKTRGYHPTPDTLRTLCREVEDQAKDLRKFLMSWQG